MSRWQVTPAIFIAGTWMTVCHEGAKKDIVLHAAMLHKR
jgi:hypothetical protein